MTCRATDALQPWNPQQTAGELAEAIIVELSEFYHSKTTHLSQRPGPKVCCHRLDLGNVHGHAKGFGGAVILPPVARPAWSAPFKPQSADPGVHYKLQGAPQPLPVKKLPSGAVKRRMHKYTSHHLLTLRMQPTFSSMAHVCGKTQFYTSMQACLEAKTHSFSPTAQSPVQGDAVAVAEGAVASEAMAKAWKRGAQGIAAGHSIHMLLMLGQNLVCLRVACTDIGGSLRCKSVLLMLSSMECASG